MSWLEKHKLLRTLDTLLDEGSDIASESFSMAKTVQSTVRGPIWMVNSIGAPYMPLLSLSPLIPSLLPYFPWQ